MVMTKHGGKSHKASKSHKGGKKHMASKSHKRYTRGKKHMGSKSHKRHTAGKKHIGHKGGLFLSTAAAAAKEALLPFLMYKAQKEAQKRVSGKSHKGKKLRSKSRKTTKSRR